MRGKELKVVGDGIGVVGDGIEVARGRVVVQARRTNRREREADVGAKSRRWRNSRWRRRGKEGVQHNTGTPSRTFSSE